MAGDWRDARGARGAISDERPAEHLIREARGGIPDDMVMVRRDDLAALLEARPYGVDDVAFDLMVTRLCDALDTEAI